MATQKTSSAATRRARGTNRDSFDSRDLIYRTALLDIKPVLLPDWQGIQILNQGEQGACTGFGLAATVNYLLHQRGQGGTVSARMLFEMAKRYDQWPGNRYDWSSARGAMKGWYKHGVCDAALWPNDRAADTELDRNRELAALNYPLGAYFRILPRRTDVHAALNEVGVVFAAAATHAGWDNPDKGIIPLRTDGVTTGHAFAIVGYTEQGFLVQNSWGPDWGGLVVAGRHRGGLALWSYEDFDRNVWDLWVARMALPVESMEALRSAYTAGNAGSRRSESGPPPSEVGMHLIHVDDGQFDDTGDYPSTLLKAEQLINAKVARAAQRGKLDLLMFAHGGLNTIDAAACRTRAWRDVIDSNEVEHFHWIWETGFLAELKDVLLGKDKLAAERTGGAGDWKDKFLEKSTRLIACALWDEMKDDACDAFAGAGDAGAEVLAMFGAALQKVGGIPQVRITLAGHSAGALWVGETLDAWARLQPGFKVDEVVLMAPACRVDFFQRKIFPHVKTGHVGTLTIFQLSDDIERADNVAKVYGKSLLYFVSNACEERRGGTPLLGMQCFNERWAAERAELEAAGRLNLCIATAESLDSRAHSHGGFDNDVCSMNTLLRIACGAPPEHPFTERNMEGY